MSEVEELGRKLSQAIAMDQLINRSIIITLLIRELRRDPNARTLSEEIHAVLDDYLQAGRTPQNLLEEDRQRAQVVIDVLVDAARLRLDRK